MSDILVASFPDPLRASQVLDDLDRKVADWADDFNNAAVVRWHGSRDLRVQLRVDLLNGTGANWGRLWGSLLGVALLVPGSGEVFQAMEAVEVAFQNRPAEATNRRPAHYGEHWWLDCLAAPGNFLRDVGALIRPGTSALFLLVRVGEPAVVARHLRDLGGTNLRLTLTQAQDAEIAALLEGGRQRPWLVPTAV